MSNNSGEKKQCAKCQGSGHSTAKCPRNHCSSCGKTGHLARNCQKAYCSVHQQYGHSDDNCYSRSVCATCNQSGHATEMCRTPQCKSCNRLWHTEESCYQKQTCSQCLQRGHALERCRVEPFCPHCDKEQLGDCNHYPSKCESGFKCLHCPSTKHLARDCPVWGALTPCKHCGHKGHDSADCYRLKMCDKCLEIGHHTDFCRTTPYCQTCNDDDHSPGECSLYRCAACKRGKHLPKNCPLADVDTASYSSASSAVASASSSTAEIHQKERVVVVGDTPEPRCSKCGKKDHTLAACTSEFQVLLSRTTRRRLKKAAEAATAVASVTKVAVELDNKPSTGLSDSTSLFSSAHMATVVVADGSSWADLAAAEEEATNKKTQSLLFPKPTLAVAAAVTIDPVTMAAAARAFANAMEAAAKAVNDATKQQDAAIQSFGMLLTTAMKQQQQPPTTV